MSDSSNLQEIKITAEMVAEAILLRFARSLDLGLDCNVPLMVCEEAVVSLLGELRESSWTISPPGYQPRASSR